MVSRVGTLSNAASDAVTFLANSLYRDQLAHTQAAAVILAPRARLTSRPFGTARRRVRYRPAAGFKTASTASVTSTAVLAKITFEPASSKS